jgi:hypothetical protein
LIALDVEIAAEVAALGDMLRDPADRAIVATARIQSLRLLTSDQRIIELNRSLCQLLNSCWLVILAPNLQNGAGYHAWGQGRKLSV